MYLKAGADTLAKLDHPYALAVEDLPEILIPDTGSLWGDWNAVTMAITKPVRYFELSVVRSGARASLRR